MSCVFIFAYNKKVFLLFTLLLLILTSFGWCYLFVEFLFGSFVWKFCFEALIGSFALKPWLEVLSGSSGLKLCLEVLSGGFKQICDIYFVVWKFWTEALFGSFGLKFCLEVLVGSFK